MSNEIYHMTKADAGSGVYQMNRATIDGGWEVYMMRRAVDHSWVEIGHLTFDIADATATYTFAEGDFSGGVSQGTFPGWAFFKIAYSGGAYYRGAAKGDWRAAVSWKTRSGVQTCAVAPGETGAATAAECVAVATGQEVELEAGDGTLYSGVLFASMPADRSGVVSFTLYGSK